MLVSASNAGGRAPRVAAPRRALSYNGRTLRPWASPWRTSILSTSKFSPPDITFSIPRSPALIAASNKPSSIKGCHFCGDAAEDVCDLEGVVGVGVIVELLCCQGGGPAPLQPLRQKGSDMPRVGDKERQCAREGFVVAARPLVRQLVQYGGIGAPGKFGDHGRPEVSLGFEGRSFRRHTGAMVLSEGVHQDEVVQAEVGIAGVLLRLLDQIVPQLGDFVALDAHPQILRAQPEAAELGVEVGHEGVSLLQFFQQDVMDVRHFHDEREGVGGSLHPVQERAGKLARGIVDPVIGVADVTLRREGRHEGFVAVPRLPVLVGVEVFLQFRLHRTLHLFTVCRERVKVVFGVYRGADIDDEPCREAAFSLVSVIGGKLKEAVVQNVKRRAVRAAPAALPHKNLGTRNADAVGDVLVVLGLVLDVLEVVVIAHVDLHARGVELYRLPPEVPRLLDLDEGICGVKLDVDVGAGRRVARHLLLGHVHVSFDPVILGPLDVGLYALIPHPGHRVHGEPLGVRQHPHDGEAVTSGRPLFLERPGQIQELVLGDMRRHAVAVVPDPDALRRTLLVGKAVAVNLDVDGAVRRVPRGVHRVLQRLLGGDPRHILFVVVGAELLEG